MQRVNCLSGKCVLVRRDRFAVDVSYSAPLVQLFKSMQTGQYDPATKRWTFDLSEYHDLVPGLSALSNAARIEGLPRGVLLTFDDVVHGRTSTPNFIPEVDLSCIDAPLAETLLPFQRHAINFGVYRNGRLLIADDMGLGKSLQALALAAYYRSEWPLLVVCPSSVRFAWREHVLKWLPSVEPQYINVVVSGRDPLTSGKVNIISYDLMARRVKDMDAFKVVIMDESHFLKNIKAVRTQAAVTLLKAARRVILLSGTPALSRPQELFTQISSVDHKVFPRFMEYGLRYCDAKKTQWGWDYSGSSNLHELQLVLEERIMIRRLKKDVMSQLPAKFRTMVVLDPGSLKRSRDIKASQKEFDIATGSDRRSALLQYFHETASVKSKAVTEYIMDLLEADRKLLVFAHHREVLDALENAVSKKHEYIRIDGRTSSEARDGLANNFQTNDSVRVAILSITAANAGLHLTAANLVVFAELFWNPGILAQAEDRVHRIGQEDSVTVQYLVAKDTADDSLWPLIQNKLDVLNKAGLSKDAMNMDCTTLMKVFSMQCTSQVLIVSSTGSESADITGSV
ncbi:hypothetical protein CAPTEDRAFT_109109 [Capitella teleta]|uniref:SWI/SNF-related matrix-associated actin-dependent regulator of chromatin subfamily A-like protein 1 n=1 Tax=Capitella teleta TaxID=283909 RepID=R7UDG2_CAPTE|nr:hypothetical protein CAPTEDRAFT_109109 [Capitella teleta]|eukprot:ELU01833.1 hypothetical protein CAPTEDRAFT_109109 [Capitella teleta]